jgi:hypothetical protein
LIEIKFYLALFATENYNPIPPKSFLDCIYQIALKGFSALSNLLQLINNLIVQENIVSFEEDFTFFIADFAFQNRPYRNNTALIVRFLRKQTNEKTSDI